MRVAVAAAFSIKARRRRVVVVLSVGGSEGRGRHFVIIMTLSSRHSTLIMYGSARPDTSLRVEQIWLSEDRFIKRHILPAFLQHRQAASNPNW